MMTSPQSPQQKNNQMLEIDLFGLINAVLKRWILCAGICGTAIILGLIYCFTATPIYQANCRMLVEQGSLKVTQIQDVYDSEFGRDSSSRRDFITTQMKLITSDNILAKVFEHFDFAKMPAYEHSREPLRAIEGLVVVRQIPNTNLLDIGFKDKNPVFSAQVANYIAQEYINDSRERATGFSSRGLEKLQDELVNMERNRFKAIEKLNNYKAMHDILSVDTASRLLIARLTSLDQANVSAKEMVANALSAVKAVDLWRAQHRRLDAIPEVILNPTLTNYKVSRLQAQAALVKTLQDFGPTHRAVATQRRVIEEMDKAIDEEIENSLSSITAKLEQSKIRVALIEQEISSVTRQLKELDQISDEYKVLEDNLKASEKAYQFVLSRVGELQIARSADAGAGGTFQIIVPATPPARAAYPQKAKTMVIVALAAALASVLLCILLELLDTTLKEPEEFEANTNLPLFGQIPIAESGPRVDFTAYDKPKGDIAEAFRALRTSLSLSPSLRDSNVLAVSSALPNEGKSFVSLSLAITYARTGKRVLLIDADLRKRRLTSLLFPETKNDNGLSSLLAGITSNYKGMLQTPFEDLPLSVLPSGPLPPNPVELLGSEPMKELHNVIRSAFDIVIVDTAPILPVSDTHNLAALPNLGFLIVGRFFETEKRQIADAVDVLRRANANLIGCVAQQSKEQIRGYYGYKYGSKYGYKYSYKYGYKYGYRYGEKTTKES